MRISIKNSLDYVLVTTLLIVSGNPIFIDQPWNKIGIAILGVALFLLFFNKLTKSFFKDFLFFLSGFFCIFLVQRVTLGFISTPFVLGFILKIFIGSVIYWQTKERFNIVFLNVLFWICLISFPFYIVHFFEMEFLFKHMTIGDELPTIGFYTFRPQVFSQEPLLRNSGMFWEPGAFQGYINMAIFMNLRRLSSLWKCDKFKLFVLLAALVSTQSTTGFLVFGLILLFYFLLFVRVNYFFRYVMFAFMGMVSVFLYNNLFFLGEKISNQLEEVDMLEGAFEPGRFGALLFDIHYIVKNPIFGNGFHEKTRYVDHPHLIDMIETGKDLGHGNGFSNFLASAGFLGVIWYFYAIFRMQRKINVKDSLLMCFLILVLLQGEQFQNFPFFLGLPFFISFNMDSGRNKI